jgi:hypothetical protein
MHKLILFNTVAYYTVLNTQKNIGSCTKYMNPETANLTDGVNFYVYSYNDAS